MSRLWVRKPVRFRLAIVLIVVAVLCPVRSQTDDAGRTRRLACSQRLEVPPPADEMVKGRGVGTKGIKPGPDYIARGFAQGRPQAPAGGQTAPYFQNFQVFGRALASKSRPRWSLPGPPRPEPSR